MVNKIPDGSNMIFYFLRKDGSAQQIVMDFPLDLSLLRWEDDTITTY